ncbi:hypothetical protein [Priestia koreensis]|nr:hypothetical protein [Priestia koreensis]
MKIEVTRMELIYCKEDVLKKLNDYVEVHPPVVLFRKGNTYTISQDANGQWITMDEENHPHLLSAFSTLEEDFWFNAHFEVRS